jgi:uracil-DNA glycosylase
LVDAFLSSEVGLALSKRLTDAVHAGDTIYPPEPFLALSLTPLSQVRVVILGQDPYHGPGQAEGLAFSVARGVRLPPSLRNIFKELQQSLGVPMPTDGSLVRWAKQGVLLLNTCLTVQAGQAGSHARWGWEVLSDQLVKTVAQSSRPVVFMLWGAHAQAKRDLIETAGNSVQHLVLMANHPSPLSALRAPVPFMGCGHFAQANAFLTQCGEKSIEW